MTNNHFLTELSDTLNTRCTAISEDLINILLFCKGVAKIPLALSETDNLHFEKMYLKAAANSTRPC